MRIIDNAIALRILWMIVAPIESTDAFELGIIDGEGNTIKKAKTHEEKAASTMLHRLVWRIKKFINLVPGGSTRIGSMVAAYALVRECVQKHEYLPTNKQLTEQLEVIESNTTERQLLEWSEELSIFEDVPVNSSSVNIASTDVTVKKKSKTFPVCDKTFNDLKDGKCIVRRMGAVLNLESTEDVAVFNYVQKNPVGILVLENRGQYRCVSYARNSCQLNRPSIFVIESKISSNEYSMEVVTLW